MVEEAFCHDCLDSITSTFLKEFSLSVKFFWVVFELRA